MAGNRCGHDCIHPKLSIELTHTPLAILTRIEESLSKFYRDPKILPGLNLARKKLINSVRKMRSERREAVIRVMTALLHHTELASMRVGMPTDNGFLPLGIRYFVKLTGLSQRRFERALADIRAAGFITTTERYKRRENGDYIGLNAVRCVSPKLFDAFGLGKWLAKKRNQCSQALRKKIEKISVSAFASLAMAAQGNRAGPRNRKKKYTGSQATPQPPPRNKIQTPQLREIWEKMTS